MTLRRLLALLLLVLAAPAAADPVVTPSQDPARTANGLAPTPPMGWNSWNKFACDVNETVIRATADAIASNGMKAAGYQYVVIDDCWHGARTADGFITADAGRFPSGMKALSDYVHSKGLKFGIYSDAGRETCGHRPGSQGHEYQDAIQYARWGVDYLKYDWCATNGRDAEEAYALMADALRASGRPILFSMCEWGTARPWLWAAKIGNMWRTTGDIWDSFDKTDKAHDWAHNVLDIVDRNEPLWPFAGPGHWNDPDMLEVGNGGMTTSEYRSHFALWAIMAAPLIAGNDIANMSAETRAILTNREVIAVDQDAMGVQGRRVATAGGVETWVKPLTGGGRAVLFFNRGTQATSTVVTWDQLGWPAALKVAAREAEAGRSLGRLSGRAGVTVAPHDVALLVLRP